MSVEERITAELSRIESENQVRILLACESGSRAWGFPSADSDYDVRFVYCHKPDWYLRVTPFRDVIEVPISEDLDINGWDLRKAFGLMMKSNPPLLEWLNSPIIYQEDSLALAELRRLAQECFRVDSVSYHYLRMAQSSQSGLGSGSEVKLKKYFYTLRPLMALEWIHDGRGVPPTDFTEIVRKLHPEGEVRDAIDTLISQKRLGFESNLGPRIPAIDTWIIERLAHWETKKFKRDQKEKKGPEIDAAFRKLVSC